MAGVTSKNFPSILSTTQRTNAGAVRPLANELVSYKNDHKGWAVAGRAVSEIQSQLDTVTGILRKPIPQPTEYVLTNPQGQVVATFGFQSMLSNSSQNYGLTVQDLSGNVAGSVGVQVENPKTITATTNASPDVLSIPNHGYVVGDTLLNQGATGDTAINGVVIVKTVPTVNTFTLTDLLGNPINGNGAYTAKQRHGNAVLWWGPV